MYCSYCPSSEARFPEMRKLQEQSSTWTPPPVPELRVSTLTPASIKTLQLAGAWDAIQQHAAPFRRMQV